MSDFICAGCGGIHKSDAHLLVLPLHDTDTEEFLRNIYFCSEVCEIKWFREHVMYISDERPLEGPTKHY